MWATFYTYDLKNNIYQASSNQWKIYGLSATKSVGGKTFNVVLYYDVTIAK